MMSIPVSAQDDADDLLAFDLEGADETVRVLLNLSEEPIDLPDGGMLLSSEPVVDGQLPGIAAAWVARPGPDGIQARLSTLGQLIADIVDRRH